MTMMDFSEGARRADRRDMRLMMLAIYPLCLAAALAARLLPRDGDRSEKRRSVFAEASASAHACIPFVFR